MAKGKAQKKHNEAEKLELVTAICENYGTGLYTIESCVESKGIVFRTFSDWLNENSILSELYKSAKTKSVNAKKKELRLLVENEIVKRVKGYKIDASEIEGSAQFDKSGKMIEGTFVPKHIKKKTVHIKASDPLLIFLSKNTNIDGEIEFSDLQKVESEINISSGGVIVLPARNETEEKPANLLNDLLK